MNSKLIEIALQRASDTQSLVIGKGVLSQVDEVFKRCFGNRPVVVVADENTFAAAGQAVYERFRSAGYEMGTPFIFPGQPMLHADYDRVLELQEWLRNRDVIPVAVGSGTINDITKLASHQSGRSYMVVATAASVDGYASFGASISREGYKESLPCPAPRAILADLDILASAPPEMTASGYADLLGKITAGADWLIADALEVEPIAPYAWEMVQLSLRRWLANPERLLAGDLEGIQLLFEGLTMSGLAMQAMGSSRPASGSEHYLSHLWEMQGLENHGEPVSHGFKVGIGSVAVAAFYERLLERDLSDLDISAICASWPTPEELEREIRDSFDIPAAAERAVEESLAKYIGPDQLVQRLTLLRRRWPALRDKLRSQLMTAAELQQMLRATGCPSNPTDIGLTLPQVKESYVKARQIRSRYTVLDLATETGCLTECIEGVFSSIGLWPISPGS